MPDTLRCAECDGSGRIMLDGSPTACPECEGIGVLINLDAYELPAWAITAEREEQE
jgi:DnaJ-class molecular chaperone